MNTQTLLSQLPNFNPRDVPVTGIDTHLPAVPTERLTPDALRQRFVHPPAWQPELREEPRLPDALRQRFVHPPAWQPELREEPRFADRAPAAAAVLVPLVNRPSGLSVLLTERSHKLSTHSGQVAFPGGRVDPEDVDVVDAALREAQEEVDLPRGHVDVIGQLPVYVTGTQFIITPVVAVVRPGFVLHPNPDEVAHAFEVPLSFLMNPAHHRRHRLEWQGHVREWYSMPYVERVRIEPGTGESPPTPDSEIERYIWGATAGMLRNFYRFLSA